MSNYVVLREEKVNTTIDYAGIQLPQEIINLRMYSFEDLGKALKSISESGGVLLKTVEIKEDNYNE